MRLSAYYEKQLADTAAALYPEEREYMKRAVAAVGKVRAYLNNCPDHDTRNKFFDMVMLHGDNDIQAVCNDLHISQTTYYNWRTSIIRLYGSNIGVYV
jgi:hypothetical protein